MNIKTPITLIAAMANERVIGHRNEIPWHCSYDLRYFKQYTQGKVAIMGRKTLDSLGGPLKDRKNVVLSQNPSIPYRGISVAHCLTSALKMADRYSQENDLSDIVVMGGAQLYRDTLPHASQVLLTHLPVSVMGDAHFPEMPEYLSLVHERTELIPVTVNSVASTVPVSFQRWERA